MDPLTETLRQAQRFGFFGDRPIDEAIAHARGFVDAIGSLAPGSRLIDLGSGGGLPGLVLAEAHREVAITLLDRRQKRTDFLELATRRLGFKHVRVRCADVADVIREVAADPASAFDVVTARGFGPPEFTLRSARALVADGGRIAISEPPTTGNRWDPGLLAELGLVAGPHRPVRVFVRAQPGDADRP